MAGHPERARILVVDDEQGAREALELILEDEYDLASVENGQEARARIRQYSFDLVLLDMNMPDLDGIETLKLIKEFDATIDTIMISAADSARRGARTDASVPSAVRPGTRTVDVGTWTGTSFAAKAGSTPIVVTVDGTNDTLGGVRDAINAQANGAVRASIVTDSSGSRLVISSTATGAGSALRISAADDDLDEDDDEYRDRE